LNSLVSEGLIHRKNIVLCPGNHDLNSSDAGKEWFKAFDAFSVTVRGDKECVFSDQSVKQIYAAGLTFVLINSSFHGDYAYGYAEMPRVLAKLDQLAKVNLESRVCVVHHNLLNRFREDTSTLRNAYLLLEALDSHQFRLVLHGHQHADLPMRLGKSQLLISGVGSLGYATQGFVNGFASYETSPKRTIRRRYVISDDTSNNFSELGVSLEFDH
jgi:DNA repair exonuclease SbcCD nuclease subunit